MTSIFSGKWIFHLNGLGKSYLLSWQETPNSVGEQKDTGILVVMMMMMMVMVRFMMRRRMRMRMIMMIMMMMMMMMMMKMMMLRRKTDPKTGKHALCEPAQSKCTCISQEPFCLEIYKKNAGPQSRDTRFVRACAVETHMDTSHEPFCVEIYKKMPDADSAASILCEPAQSKCTWTCHKSHFVWKCTGKMSDAPETTSIKHRALTLTVTTPQCGHTVWGKKKKCCCEIMTFWDSCPTRTSICSAIVVRPFLQNHLTISSRHNTTEQSIEHSQEWIMDCSLHVPTPLSFLWPLYVW